MAYTRINWQNDPESPTPISAENLNHMDQGIYEVTQKVDSSVGSSTHLLTVNTGITVSSSVEIAFATFQTLADNVAVSVSGLVSGTISADNTTITMTVKADGTTIFTFSQICHSGSNTIPIIVGVPLAHSGNHIVSVECSATNGTFSV